MGKNGEGRRSEGSPVKDTTTLKLNYDPAMGKPQKMVMLTGKTKNPLNAEDDREGVLQAIFLMEGLGPVLAESEDNGNSWKAIAVLEKEELGLDEEE